MTRTRIEDAPCATCEGAGAIVSVSGAEPFAVCFAGTVQGVNVPLRDAADCPYYDRRETEAERYDRSNMESDWW